MKKIISFALCFIMPFVFCGCSFGSVFTAESAGYTATAIGFEQSGNLIKVILEAVTVNSEDADADIKTEILTGEGKTVKEAMEQIHKKTAKPLRLAHIGIAAVSYGISDERFFEIKKFCYDIDKITLAMLWVSTDSAEKLLSCAPVSSIAVGYDIMSMQKEQTNRTGTEFKNRFYEIESADQKPLNIFALPYFKVDSDKFFYDGVAVYENGTVKMKLDSEEAFFYAVAVNSQKEGTVFLDGKTQKIKSANSKFVFENNNDKAKLCVNLKTDRKDDIKKGIEKLFKKAKFFNTDILGVGNEIYRKEPKKWEKIKNNYSEIYRSMELTVEIK